MTLTILSTTLFLVFMLLGGFHFYWLFGGHWGLEKVIPKKENKANTQPIPKSATLIVALVLIVFGLMYLTKSGLTTFDVPSWVTNYGYWVIPAIFTLRAIGDFNYLGFFKKVRNTEFAKADSKIFSPLCLGIGIIGIIINLI